MAELSWNIKAKWVKKILLTFCAMFFLSLVTCHWWYTGDGHLVDRGCSALHPRYILKLDTVDLSKIITYTYRMKTLPGTQLTMGFHITGPDPNESSHAKIHIGETHPINPKVHLFLENSQGLRVIDEIGALKNEWVWSYVWGNPQEAFVYRAGEMEEVPIGKGTVHLNRIGVKDDGGWGTYFTPNFWDEYHLVLEVLEEDPNAKKFKIELQAEGGGWVLP